MSPADSRPSRAPAALAIALSSLLGTSAISADPASSADSAWLPLPERSGAELDGPLEQRGRDVFDQRCAACHGEVPDEIYGPQFLPPMPGTQVLEARYQGALPAVLDARTDLSADYIEAVVRGGLRSMPFFRPTEVSGEDLAALIAYLTRDRSAE